MLDEDPLLFEPGTQHRYSIWGWVLVSAVVEGAAGEPFTRFMDGQVFEPLAMERTVVAEIEGLDGKVKKLKVAKLRGGAAWAPTTIVTLYVNMLGAAAEDGFTAIAVKFKAKDVKVKGAGWMIDDLFVDPLKTW